MIVTLDLSESSNLSYSTKGAKSQKKLEPGQIAFMMHAQAGFGDYSKGIAHSAEHLPRKR
jgi:hypothetical protein